MSHTTTVVLNDTEEQAMTTITNNIDEWIQNSALNRARIAKEEIIGILIAYCNTNDIDIATGESAQVQQAFDLGLVEAISNEPPSPPTLP